MAVAPDSSTLLENQGRGRGGLPSRGSPESDTTEARLTYGQIWLEEHLRIGLSLPV